MSGRLEARMMVEPPGAGSGGPSSGADVADALAEVEHGFEAVAADEGGGPLTDVPIAAPCSAEPPSMVAAVAPTPTLAVASESAEEELGDDLAVDFRNIEAVLADETGALPTVDSCAVKGDGRMLQPASTTPTPRGSGVAVSRDVIDSAASGKAAVEGSPTSAGESPVNVSTPADHAPAEPTASGRAAPALPTTASPASSASGAAGADAPGAPPPSPAAVAASTTVATGAAAIAPASPPSSALAGAVVVTTMSWLNLPLRKLPARARMVVNMFAATLLLWAPVVWLTPRELVASQHDVAVDHDAAEGGHGEDARAPEAHGDAHAKPSAKKGSDAHADDGGGH